MRRIGTVTMGTALALAFLLLAAGRSAAKTIEEIVDLPVKVTDKTGAEVAHTIKLTIHRDDDRAKAPFLVLNHGRAGKAADRASLGRARYGANSQYFVALGYTVFVPTRIGYGETGGPDVENTGPCRRKVYPPGYEAAAQLTLQVIDYAKSLSHVDATRGVVMGQSYGGMTALTIAAKDIPGILAAVNFAGGGGGDPIVSPEKPCGPEQLTRMVATYGATSRIPTLWLYSANDRYWGPDLPRTWLKAFTDRGGKAEFVALPAHGEDGHGSFTRNPDAWKPAVERFLEACCALVPAPPPR